MKIGELAKRANLNPSAIRYYEKLGLLPAPARTSGQRRYSTESLDRVLLIRFAGEMGFSLPEVKTFLSGIRETAPVGSRWRSLAERKIIEMRRVIARAQRLEKLMRGLSRCHCSSLHECVRRLELSENRSFVARTAPRKRKFSTSLPV
jgi:MerR family redox-sensitive transcriptional activator SoxR